MSENDLKQRTVSALFWKFCQNGVGQLIGFAISILLARLLMPEDFGIVALAGMFTTLLGLFIGCGMATALIQKKEVDDLDYCTMFWAQTLFSIIVYCVLYLLAPWFSSLFHTPQLVSVIRICSLTVIIGAIGGIQEVIVTRQMAFKIYFYRTLIAFALSGLIGVYLAFAG